MTRWCVVGAVSGVLEGGGFSQAFWEMCGERERGKCWGSDVVGKVWQAERRLTREVILMERVVGELRARQRVRGRVTRERMSVKWADRLEGRGYTEV